MADKPAKSKKGKPADGVLGSLPATRPTRMSRRARADASGPSMEATRAAGRGAKATSAASRSAKPRTAKAAAAKATAAKATPAPRAAPAPVQAIAEPTAARRPRAVREASPALKEPAAKAAAQREDTVTRPNPSGTELVGTVVQAAGELASIGVTIGGQLLRRAAERIPRP